MAVEALNTCLCFIYLSIYLDMCIYIYIYISIVCMHLNSRYVRLEPSLKISLFKFSFQTPGMASISREALFSGQFVEFRSFETQIKRSLYNSGRSVEVIGWRDFTVFVQTDY